MSCVQWNREVQTCSPHRSNHPFTDGICHGCSYWGFDDAQSHVPYTLINLFGENRVSGMDQEAIRVIGWNRFAELLHGPLRRGMCGNIDLKQSAPRMLNYHKHIEPMKGRRDRHAKVTRQYPFSMSADKGGPALSLTPLAWATDAVVRHVLAHGPR